MHPIKIMALCLACLLMGMVGVSPGIQAEWRQAAPGYRFSFPRDHACHPEYKIEWWYYTGNLGSSDGRRFGFQLTFFRVGLDPAPANPSRWAVRDLFMTHFAVSAISDGKFHFAERLNRAGPGWAGASAESFHVWNEDWTGILDAQGNHRLKARDGPIGISLLLEEGKPPVLHGVDGYSRKGSLTGNASQYYSLTRMPTRGEIFLKDERIAVSGESWMDHEFGTSFLDESQIGWDWFSVQLEDGTEWMLFQLRRADGRGEIRASGTFVERSGRTTALPPGSFQLKPLSHWRSPHSGALYPVAWELRVPSADLQLTVTAALDNQELRTPNSTRITYWEGAVRVAGRRGSQSVRGRGYLELTGYTGDSLGRVLR